MIKEEAERLVRAAMGDRECEIRAFAHSLGPIVEVTRQGRSFTIHMISDAPEAHPFLIADAVNMYDHQDWTVTT
jgi:hypothetical protein